VTETILKIVVSGLLNGSIYALVAMGLSLQYGVARVLNIAHGEFIMLGALTTWTLYTGFGINPLLSVVISGPLLFVIGFVLYRTLFTGLKSRAPSPAALEGNSLLVAFGLMFIIQNIALLIWSPLGKSYKYLDTAVWLAGTAFRANRLVALAIAVGVGVAFYLFLTRSRPGKAIRAAAQDPATAGLMGININRVLPLCFGLGAFLAGLAGVLISMCYTGNTPFMGLSNTVIALIVVVLGGLGSIPGSFAGGLILGLLGSLVSNWNTALVLVAFYAIFMILLLIRPAGIFGKK
jgi:branched-chain amino acid transport system permease protein